MYSFTQVADHCRKYLSSTFPPEEFIAYARQWLPAGKDSMNDWQTALSLAHKSFVGKTTHEAERLVKTEAARVLHRPSILEAFEEREASRIRLAEAQASHDRIAYKEAAERNFAIQKQQADQRAREREARWARNWDAEIKAQEDYAAELYSKGDLSVLSVGDQSRLKHAFAEIAKLEILKRIAARREA